MFLATQLQNWVFKVGVELRPWFLPSVDLNHISGCDECWGCGVKARF